MTSQTFAQALRSTTPSHSPNPQSPSSSSIQTKYINQEIISCHYLFNIEQKYQVPKLF